MNSLHAAQDLPDTGYFRANITSQGTARPIAGATIQISDINNPDDILEEITTDGNGQSETVSLAAPPLEYSMVPESSQPYAVYNIRISAPGYESRDVSGAEILSGETAIQDAALLPLDETEPDSEELFVIPPHTLYGDFPPKIPEDEIKTVTQTGEIVLSRVVIPPGVRNFLIVKSQIGLRWGFLTCAIGEIDKSGCIRYFSTVPNCLRARIFLTVPLCQRIASPLACITSPVLR